MDSASGIGAGLSWLSPRSDTRDEPTSAINHRERPPAARCPTAAVIVPIAEGLRSAERPLTSVEQNQLTRDLTGHQGDEAVIDLGERHRRAHEFVQFELPGEVPVDVLRHVEPEAIRTHV